MLILTLQLNFFTLNLRTFEKIMNIDQFIADLKETKCLHERDLRVVCEKVKEILLQESNVQPVSSPVTVCGDIHGQFYDVLELFRTGGQIEDTCYIFIGDFVDRGYHSVETFQYLLCLKLKYPDRITLLRGNHQSRQITTVYGFYDEINKKYGNPNPWKYCTDVFDYLPIGAVIDGRVFCVHGGLSPEIKTIDQIRTIDRKIQIPHEGPFCDLMWSDPEDIQDWAINARGAGWVFGSKVTDDFCHINGIQTIARAHQLVQEGYQFWFKNKNLVTVWSAPNYCYRCNNLAAIMEVKQGQDHQFKIFKTVPESMKSVHFKSVLPYFL